MYGLVQAVERRTVLGREGVCLAAALVTAELLYKFHSFTLEALAFLGTWFALSWIADRISGRAR